MRWTTENLTTESASQMIRKIPIFTALKMKAVISSITGFCRKTMRILSFKWGACERTSLNVVT